MFQNNNTYCPEILPEINDHLQKYFLNAPLIPNDILLIFK